MSKLLRWQDLTQLEQVMATEQYLYIRECEEGRNRDEITNDYPEVMDGELVKQCGFEKVNDCIEVII